MNNKQFFIRLGCAFIFLTGCFVGVLIVGAQKAQIGNSSLLSFCAIIYLYFYIKVANKFVERL